MRGKINLDYDISPSPFNRHRALYLYAPTTDMSGNYTCKVSTLQNEVTMTKAMIVYGERCEKKAKIRPLFIGGRRGVLWEIELGLFLPPWPTILSVPRSRFLPLFLLPIDLDRSCGFPLFFAHILRSRGTRFPDLEYVEARLYRKDIESSII